MQDVGRWMIITGVAVAAGGVVVWALSRAGVHGLPGDIRYESDHVRVYVPIVTCLVLSVLLSALAWLWRWMQR